MVDSFRVGVSRPSIMNPAMTTEKDKYQTKQDVQSPSQGPHRKVPADDHKGSPGGQQRGMNSTST